MPSSGSTEGEKALPLKNITNKSTSKSKKSSNKSEEKATSVKEPKNTASKTKKEAKEPKDTASKTKKEPKDTAAKSKSKDESPKSLNSMDTWSTESSWHTSDEEFLASDDEDADAREQLDEICNMLRKGRCRAN